MEFRVQEPKTVTVYIGDKSYEIKKPRMVHQRKLELDMQEAQEQKKSSLQPMIDYVKSLGLTEEIILDMDQDDFGSLVEFLVGVKKKKD